MPIINLEQGSEEWLKYRRSRIMATDASIIIGTNPWRSTQELWEEKLLLRDPQPINDAILRGQKLEPEARKLASEVLGIDFQPCVYQSDKHYWMAASLDGISSCGKYVLEIKCPKEESHIKGIRGEIAGYYQTQMQHQFSCTSCENIIYFTYRPEYKEKFGYWDVKRDDEFIEKMILIENEFYINLCTFNPPAWRLKQRKSH